MEIHWIYIYLLYSVVQSFAVFESHLTHCARVPLGDFLGTPDRPEFGKLTKLSFQHFSAFSGFFRRGSGEKQLRTVGMPRPHVLEI
jgi:hypothetical protein